MFTARNCAEAGKLGCVVNPDEGEFCGITVAQGGECFCDANCNVSSYDCCEDALQGFPPSKLLCNFGGLSYSS